MLILLSSAFLAVGLTSFFYSYRYYNKANKRTSTKKPDTGYTNTKKPPPTPKVIPITKFLAESNSINTFFNLINNTLSNKSKLHIKAPTGAGKNTLAEEYIDKYQDLNIIYLFPQISIGTQFKGKLKKRNIDAIEYNSTTREKIDWTSYPGSKVVMATIDSFTHLKDELWTKKDTLVFLDETHTMLQSYRFNFSFSIRALRNYPVVGFSATPHEFVNDHVIEFDEEIHVIPQNLRVKTVQPILTDGATFTLNEYVAYRCLKSANDGLVIVFTNNIKDMDKIEEWIHFENANLKVEVFNAETKINSKAWDHLMDEGEIDPDTNVVILNAVANAGVNIENTDISQVFLVGNFDILGFLQYLGRPRYYTREFEYIYNTSGKFYKEFRKADVETLQEYSKIIWDAVEDAKIDGFEYYECKMKSSGQNIHEDQLLNAYEHYRKVNAGLKGDELCNNLKNKNIKDVNWLNQKEVTQKDLDALKQPFIDAKKQDLIDFIVDPKSIASQLDHNIKWSDSWPDVIKFLKAPKKNNLIINPAATPFRNFVNNSQFNNEDEIKDALKRIRQIKDLGIRPEYYKTAIRMTDTSKNKPAEARKKAELIIRGSSKIIPHYVYVCKIFNGGFPNYDYGESVALVNHFKDLKKTKKEFKHPDLVQEINVATGASFDTTNIDKIYKAIVRKAKRTNSKTGISGKIYIVETINLKFKDYINNYNWLNDYNKI